MADLETNPHGLSCIGSATFSMDARPAWVALPPGGERGRARHAISEVEEPKSRSSRASEKGRSRSPRQTSDMTEEEMASTALQRGPIWAGSTRM